MTSLLFIGKNSKFFTETKDDLSKQFSLIAISHKEIKKTATCFDLVIVGSFSKSLVSNLILFEKIKSSFFFKRIIYLSSAVAELDDSYNYFKYVKIKKQLEKEFFLTFKKNSIIVRPYLIKKIEASDCILFTKSDHFVNKIQSICQNNKIKKIVSFDPVVLKSIRSPNYIYKFLFAKKLFLFCRFFDLFYRSFGFKNYGYTYGLFLKYRLKFI